MDFARACNLLHHLLFGGRRLFSYLCLANMLATGYNVSYVVATGAPFAITFACLQANRVRKLCPG
jgi:hypothetical protein